MKRLPIVTLALLLLAGALVRVSPAQDAQTYSTRKVTTKTLPRYPELAKTMNLKGTVKLEALVLANGKVKSIQVKGGHAVLVQSAENALRGWRWEKADHDTTEPVDF